MFYLVQNSTEERYPVLLKAMEKLGIEYEVCKYRPFVNEIEFTTDRKDIWCFGAYDMTSVSGKYGFKPGQMANDNHNFEVYAPKYGYENMLNGDCIIMDFDTPLPKDENWDLFFARPTVDRKIFTAKVYDREEWDKYVNTCKENGTLDIVKNDTKVVISTPKNIQQEIRCWVVDGKVITISQYRLGYKVTSRNLDDDKEAFDFAQSMVNKYQTAEAFCIDICRTDEGFKIIEINCINGSGFYHMDCEKLLLALENKFNMGKDFIHDPKKRYKFDEWIIKENKIIRKFLLPTNNLIGLTIEKSATYQYESDKKIYEYILNGPESIEILISIIECETCENSKEVIFNRLMSCTNPNVPETPTKIGDKSFGSDTHIFFMKYNLSVDVRSIGDIEYDVTEICKKIEESI